MNEKGERSCDLRKKVKRSKTKEKQTTQSTKSVTTADTANSQISIAKPAKVGEKRKRVASTPSEKKSAKV